MTESKSKEREESEEVKISNENENETKEWIQRKNKFTGENFSNLNKATRWR